MIDRIRGNKRIVVIERSVDCGNIDGESFEKIIRKIESEGWGVLECDMNPFLFIVEFQKEGIE